MITEQVRGALGRTITRKFCENGQLRVVTLDAELEKKVLAALTKNEHGVYLALSLILCSRSYSRWESCGRNLRSSPKRPFC